MKSGARGLTDPRLSCGATTARPPADRYVLLAGSFLMVLCGKASSDMYST